MIKTNTNKISYFGFIIGLGAGHPHYKILWYEYSSYLYITTELFRNCFTFFFVNSLTLFVFLTIIFVRSLTSPFRYFFTPAKINKHIITIRFKIINLGILIHYQSYLIKAISFKNYLANSYGTKNLHASALPNSLNK